MNILKNKWANLILIAVILIGAAVVAQLLVREETVIVQHPQDGSLESFTVKREVVNPFKRS